MDLKKLFIVLNLISFSAFGNINAYFNHNQSQNYTDPYRNIRRSGDNLEAVMIKEILSARKSIYVAVQEFRLPLLAQALIDKKNQGVDVRIVLENNYNFDVLGQRDSGPENEHDASRLQELRAFVDVNRDGKFSREELLTRDAIYMLRSAEIPVMDDTFDSSSGSGLMHHKFIIIDGKSTVVSTANFTMSCIHGDVLNRSSRGNANSLIVVTAPNFARLFTDEFSQLWGNGRRGNYGQSKTYRGPQTTSVRGSRITVQFSPTSQRFNWEESVNGLIGAHIQRATRSVQAALFVFSDQRLADVLQNKHEQGTYIGVIIEPKFAYRDYSELLDILGLQMLNQRCAYEPNNNPWRNPAPEAGMAQLTSGDVLHHKFAVIDGRKVVVGSQNWSDSANYINDETLIVIEDQGIAYKFAQEYERIRRTATNPLAMVHKEIRDRELACAKLGHRY